MTLIMKPWHVPRYAARNMALYIDRSTGDAMQFCTEKVKSIRKRRFIHIYHVGFT